MRKGLLISFAVLLSVTAASAYLGQIMNRFSAPYGGRMGLRTLATDGTYLYGYEFYMGYNRIYRLNMTNGSVVSSFDSPIDIPYGLGYEYGGYLWFGRSRGGSSRPALLMRCNAVTGSVYSSFQVGPHTMFGGVACQGIPDQPGTLDAIISGDSDGARIISRHTPAGSLINTFSYTSYMYKSHDCAWDYRNQLIWFTDSDDTWPAPPICGFTTDGSLVASFTPPLILAYGLTYYEGYLWVSNIFCEPMDVIQVHCPILTGVTPASIGKVKALFR